jgi:spermidine synthase
MNTSTPSTGGSAARYLPLLLVLFAGSGCSALIYEIVWYQLLQLAIGSTTVSLAFLLATYMGGLCIGSLYLPRMQRAKRHHPLKVYAALELGIAILGIIVLYAIPLIDHIYVAGAEHGMPSILLRGFFCGIVLLPPTILMGASLPAIVRWIKSTPRGVAWWGLLYGGNTVGAVFGCLLAGFYLLRVYNMATATYAAVAINLAVAAASYALAGHTPSEAAAGDAPEPAPAAQQPVVEPAVSRWTIYVTIGLSGACALGAEVVWTRLMGMMLGATVYVFSIILAVFLAGLAIGSSAGSVLLRTAKSTRSPRLALGWCQIFLAAGIAWTAYMIANSLPFWPINPLLTTSPWFTFQLDLVRCLWAMLPPTLLWGASFPLALAAAAQPGEDPGRVVGAVYAANTVGAIVGALGISLIVVPWIGTQQAQRILLLTSAASALFVLAPYVRQYQARAMAGWLVVSLVAAVFLASNLDPIPGKLIAYGRRLPISANSSTVLYTAEGINSSVAITQWNDGAVEVDVNGHVEATTEPYDMKLQRMVGHLPALIHPDPKSVLGIGFGAGVSAGTFTRYPTIQHITVCEIEPIIPPTSTRYFYRQDYDVLHNPKTRIIFDDARHYLMTTTDMYDVIASDPLDVFVKGTAALYSKEYFEAVKRHLNPGGMFSLYVPLYESDERTVRSELATFFEAFPNATVWANTVNGQGYDMVFMGQVAPFKVNIDEIEERLSRPDYALVAQSLRDIGINSATDLFATYAGQRSDLGRWTEGADINHDDDLRLSYLAGWGINSSLEDFIYRQMMKYREMPVGMFTGSPSHVQNLMSAMGANSGQ